MENSNRTNFRMVDVFQLYWSGFMNRESFTNSGKKWLDYRRLKCMLKKCKGFHKAKLVHLSSKTTSTTRQQQ